MTTAGRGESSRLRREVRQLRQERDIPAKAAARSAEGRPERAYEPMRTNRAVHPIRTMARVPVVSACGFHAWLGARSRPGRDATPPFSPYPHRSCRPPWHRRRAAHPCRTACQGSCGPQAGSAADARGHDRGRQPKAQGGDRLRSRAGAPDRPRSCPSRLPCRWRGQGVGGRHRFHPHCGARSSAVGLGPTAATWRTSPPCRTPGRDGSPAGRSVTRVERGERSFAPGDRVITKGVLYARPGAKVVPQLEGAASAPSASSPASFAPVPSGTSS